MVIRINESPLTRWFITCIFITVNQMLNDFQGGKDILISDYRLTVNNYAGGLSKLNMSLKLDAE